MKIKFFLKASIPFGIILFCLYFFIPFFRRGQTLTQIVIKVIVTAVVYGIVMLLIRKKKNNSDENE